ncbi:tetratricopeptide repeat protein [Lactobacillus sp. S2-2]|uniref:tetratricopeptide repeat protein n=1 Tax=Lactobacillus sp. S2-2 TaxID=2692917 RepID=UPI001F383274|nr:tetratricopeptide repeat protein [Lactobacillus sp. S2-2]MCF6515023.1 tetratricopeptide repeat protein [Lactobacillus sp. S2-2]
MTFSEEALENIQDGKMDDFNKNLIKAKENDSDEILYSLAEELYTLGFLDESIQVYQQLLEKYPDEDQIKTEIADIYISQDKNDEALNYLSQIEKSSPNYVNALMVEADLYQTQELTDVSEQKLLEAEKIMPDEDIIKFALGELYFSIGRYEDSVNIYLNIIKHGTLEISSVNLVERLGVSYANLGKFEQAIGYLEQIKPIDMNSDVKFETGFTYLQLNRTNDAIKMFSDLKDEDPQYATTYPYLSDALKANNQIEEAFKVIQEGLGVDKYNVNMYLKAYNLAILLEDYDNAENYLKEGNVIDPDNITVIVNLSNLYLQKEQYEENIKFLANYLETDDMDPQVYWNLAISYYHLEKFEDAKKYFDESIGYFKNNSEFLKQAIMFYREYGDISTTIQLLKEYLKIVPSDEEMTFMLEDLEEY